MTPRFPQRTSPDRTAVWLIFPFLLGLSAPLACAQTSNYAEPPPAHPSTPASTTLAVTLNLPECIQVALQRQPRIAAERASLASAEDGKRAIDNLRIPAIVDHEIPYRRRQAALGVDAAAAGLDKAEHETIYAVTRTYLTVLYAREQERITRNVVERLSATHDTAKQMLKEGARDVTTNDVNRALVYLRQAQAKQSQASQGAKRALAALKEALGLGPDVRLDVPAGRLPDSDLRPSREEIVGLALARRGDLAQATLFAEVVCLEIEAQGSSMHLKMETFAAGSDIHSSQVPQEFHNGEYRPGAVPPAMPTLLVGSRAERVKHAQSLYARAGAVVEVTRNLIALEAEDAFLRWEEASVQVPQTREAADAGDKLADDLSRDFRAGLKVKTDEVITASALAAQTRAQYNEYLYHKILALADLERITAGGFCAKLADSTLPPPRTVPQGSNGAK
jgi:outer membrane protein TolC